MADIEVWMFKPDEIKAVQRELKCRKADAVLELGRRKREGQDIGYTQEESRALVQAWMERLHADEMPPDDPA